MLLFVETTFSTLADYATSLPEPVELLVFGIVLTTVAFLLRTAPPKATPPKNDSEAVRKA